MTTKEEVCADLRERYLRFFANLTGKDVNIELYEDTSVSGTLVAVKSDSTDYLIENLKTPMGVVGNAIIRGSDTVALSVDVSKLKE